MSSHSFKAYQKDGQERVEHFQCPPGATAKIARVPIAGKFGIPHPEQVIFFAGGQVLNNETVLDTIPPEIKLEIFYRPYYDLAGLDTPTLD
jgi:hypothetical protein